ncbi:hypothetical protein BESB_032580 [Besnoitia besnoiti]|uniref:Uncharacterized protein n=1 Tax=Besnoitia besnoiti TaxID=94643 RepID=A0A2A9M428_BESBE|nr:uncharacterized protein BESB_032580 [Besnoitia besnoiti]PFH31061.1 hypothetical protein BESB_032580 [Besnoitia besnoiti]
MLCFQSFAQGAGDEGTSARLSAASRDAETCGESSRIVFPVDSLKSHEDAKGGARAQPVRVHFAYARGRRGQEKPMQVVIPTHAGTGYTLVLLEVYRGLDLPVNFLKEIQLKLGKTRGEDPETAPSAADAKKGNATDQPQQHEEKGAEDSEDVLFLKVFAEPLNQHGVVVSHPEKRPLSMLGLGSDSTRATGSTHAFVSEIQPEEAGDVAVAFALVRPWKMSDAPQVFVALAHFD